MPQSTSKRRREVPSDDLVAGGSALDVTCRPLTAMPLVDSRSTTYQSAPRCWSSKCRRETFGSSSTKSQRWLRPTTARGWSITNVLPSSVSSARLTGFWAGRPRDCLARPGGRVDHRRAQVALGGLLALRLRRLHEPGLDPELAHPQPLVGLERDLGPGQQREALARRVLEQVGGQLVQRAPARSPRTAAGPRARGRRCTRSGT